MHQQQARVRNPAPGLRVRATVDWSVVGCRHYAAAQRVVGGEAVEIRLDSSAEFPWRISVFLRSTGDRLGTLASTNPESPCILAISGDMRRSRSFKMFEFQG